MNFDPILIEDKEKEQKIEERKNDLKHFMKKKKNEAGSNQAKGDIIWMKGMDDVVNLNTSENDVGQKKTDYSAKKDKEDFVDCHKMYLDLDNIEKELGETDEFESKAQDYGNDGNHDINKDTRDFNIVDVNIIIKNLMKPNLICEIFHKYFFIFFNLFYFLIFFIG